MSIRAGKHSAAVSLAPGILLLLFHLCCGAQGVRQSSPAAPGSAAEREFQAAMAAEDQGDLGRAEKMLMQLRVKYPGNFAIDESLGLVEIELDKLAEAVPLLDAATREDPASDAAHANFGAALFRLHRNQQALEQFEQAARLNPSNAQTQQSLGQLWMEAHQPGRAANAFATALKLDPTNSGLYLNCASALVEAGNTAAAGQVLARMPGVDQSASAQSMLGDISEKSGNYLDAVQRYSNAAKLQPTEANYWSLAIEFLRHWTFDAAIREFEFARAKFPQSIRMRFGLGVALYGDQKYSAAVPVFADLLASEPSNTRYAELLGLSCTAVSQDARPRCASLVSYAQSHLDDPRVCTLAATFLMNDALPGTEVSAARPMLQAALAKDPESADAQFQMGLLKQHGGDWPGSVPNLEKAILLQPDFAKAHYRLGLAYSRLGRKEQGQEQMELVKKYSAEQSKEMDNKLQQITTYLIDFHDTSKP